MNLLLILLLNLLILNVMSAGLLSSPLLAGVGGVISSVVGAISGSKNTKRTNDANLQINQLNNEFNERMMHEQMDYNTMMWQKQNEYNTPSAQMQRMRDAGVNPYMALGNVSSGSASSAGSTSAASAAPAAAQQAFLPDFSGIGDAIMKVIQGKNVEADTALKVTDNQTQAFRNMHQIMSLIADNKNKELDNMLKNTVLSYADQVQREQLRNLQAQTENYLREGLLLDKELANFDEQIRLEFAQRSANIILTNNQARKTKQETIHDIQKMIETVARTKGINISNDVVKRTADSLVEKARVEADLAPYTFGPQNIFSSSYGVGYQFDRNKRK